MTQLSHINERGEAHMVDVSAKPESVREAEAVAVVHLRPETVAMITDGTTPKGDVFAVARVAGIQAAKHTASLIPLCHPIPLSAVEVGFRSADDRIEISATARTVAQTGVEMEALTAASVAALTVYDMCKGVDKTIEIKSVRLARKTKRPLS